VAEIETETTGQANIMIVDDAPASLQTLSDILKKQGYIPRPSPSGELALKMAKIEQPDVIMIDREMPDMDGYELYTQLNSDDELKKIPVLFINPLSETRERIKKEATGYFDFIAKPFKPEEVLARVQTQLKVRQLQVELDKREALLQEKAEARAKELTKPYLEMVFSLTKLAESRDDSAGRHLERIQAFCKLLATRLIEHLKYKGELDSTFIEHIFMASPLHDIGKIGIPDSILFKPGRLSPEEFEVMKNHTVIGYRTIESVHRIFPENTFIKIASQIARSHHEKWDGGGYPDGLHGEDIPLPARIMAIADVYDALRTPRIYKQSFNHLESCDIIIEGSDTHFDPLMVEIFKQLEPKFAKIWQSMTDLQLAKTASLKDPNR
jgi:putative two-component system response regulator